MQHLNLLKNLATSIAEKVTANFILAQLFIINSLLKGKTHKFDVLKCLVHADFSLKKDSGSKV